MHLVFRPLPTWPGPLNEAPDQGPFKVTWSGTVRLLEREVDMLMTGAQRRDGEVVLQVDAPESAMRLDGGMRADARVRYQGVILSFESKHGPLQYTCDRYTRGWSRNSMEGWQHNVRAIALGLEALRKVERYGITRAGEQYRGWNQLGSGTPMGPAMTADEAAALLIEHAEFPPGGQLSVADLFASVNNVTFAWRSAVRRHHPDHGGEPGVFRKLTEARDLLLDLAKQRAG